MVDSELRWRLEASGAVVIEGPKATGKTATARQACASEVLLDVDANARVAASIAPNLVLEGATPRLLDEWQVEPGIWNHVRRAVDERGRPGQFILTGSAVPPDDITRHTGAGRLSRLRMRPMSLYESGHSAGTCSLARLLTAPEPGWGCPDPGLDLQAVIELIVHGGWPGLLELSVAAASRTLVDYLDEVCRLDVHRVDGVSRDPARVGRLLASLARNVATEATLATLAADAAGAEGGLDPRTVASYLEALERLMVVEDQAAWAPHLRSRSTLRQTPKRHFVDPSLAAAALPAGPDRLQRDLRTLGLFFESLVMRDLRVHAQAADARVWHYRDNTGLEVDAIVQAAGGAWVAIEVKLGGQAQIDQAAEGLSRLAQRVDIARTGEPSALVVVTATGYGFVRPDGVRVVPVGALAP